MTCAIRAAVGDWGGSRLEDVEAVARSTAACFDVCEDDESIAIVLEATASKEDAPVTLFATNEAGEFVVRLNVRGNLWARLAYQFAHEFSHVLADPRTFTFDRFTWVEEALCETASLHALRAMAQAWSTDPPFENWRDYSASLAGYEAEHVSEPARSLPLGIDFTSWFAERLPLLEANPGFRDENTVIAKEFLPIVEADRHAWCAVRFLHAWARPEASEEFLATCLKQWAEACRAESRPAVYAVADALGARSR